MREFTSESELQFVEHQDLTEVVGGFSLAAVSTPAMTPGECIPWPGGGFLCRDENNDVVPVPAA